MRWTLAAALVAMASSGCSGPTVPPPQTAPVVPVGEDGDHAPTPAPTPAAEPSPKLRVTRVGQCNRLIEVINRLQGPLKSASGSDPAALRKLAEMLDHVAGRVARVRLDDGQLTKLAKAYAAMSSELAAASRKTAKALEDNDPKRAMEAAEGMKGFGPRESEVVDRLNRHCSQQLTDDELALALDRCRGSDAAACYRLALHLDDAKEDRAPLLFKKACARGEEEACAWLGEKYLKKDEPSPYPHRPEQGVALLERACSAGWAHACSALAGALAEGLGTTKAPERAWTLWVQACEAGHGNACDRLKGQRHHDPPRVEAAWTTACDRWGDYSACDALGRE